MYYVIKVLSCLICLSPTPVRNLVAFIIGRLGWLVVNKRRKQTSIDNVLKSGLTSDPEQAAAIVKASVYRFGPMLVEVLLFPQLTPAKIQAQVAFTGREHLEAALSYGKGVVLATAHSGNWELLGAALAYEGFPLVAVVRKQNDLGADKFINEYRTQAGMHVTYKTSVKEMVRLLGEGKIVGLLMDQAAGADGIMLDFFNRPASIPQGPAALARLKGAPIVPAFITALPDGAHQAIIHPPVWVEKTADREHDIRQTTAKLNRIIEDHIRLHPTEWFWLHNRWKL